MSGKDHQLTELDPDVEGEQRDQQVGAGKLQVFLEAVREPESVDKAKHAGDEHATGKVDAHDVLERHVHDRRGDGHFHERRKPRACREPGGRPSRSA